MKSHGCRWMRRKSLMRRRASACVAGFQPPMPWPSPGKLTSSSDGALGSQHDLAALAASTNARAWAKGLGYG